jgi:hypothetical protein
LESVSSLDEYEEILSRPVHLKAGTQPTRIKRILGACWISAQMSEGCDLVRVFSSSVEGTVSREAYSVM